jgi:molybdopterin-biosynthesis enzyme MoeA-like protein
LKEVRIVADDAEAIVEAVNAMRARWTYLFTTGGIGPPHDDITADSVAAAFDVGIDHDPRAVAILEEHYKAGELNTSRLRMARIPDGADLIENKVSKAPGFRLGNVYVMAGVPSVMQAMMDAIAPTLKSNSALLSETIDTGVGEGVVAEPLRLAQARHPDVVMGSYPYLREGLFATKLVLRSREQDKLAAACADIEVMLADLKDRKQTQI